MTQRLETPSSVFDDLVALLQFAEATAAELERLQLERRQLQHELERTDAEFTRQIDVGHLPIAELAELARIDAALSLNEDDVAAILTRLQTVLSSSPPAEA